VGLFLTARISDRSHERIAVGVGIVSTLLAALIGFAISGLDPTLASTDLGLYSCLPLLVAFGVIFGKLERRRRATQTGHLIRATIQSSNPEEHGGFAFVGRPVGCRESRFHFTVARRLNSRLIALQLFSCRRNANRGAQVRRWT
jgi:hypothetical protein